jgi:hypothetical protein
MCESVVVNDCIVWSSHPSPTTSSPTTITTNTLLGFLLMPHCKHEQGQHKHHGH